jgi:endonuclease/exonuclease/phosphatase family metal-dependent hydrolase
MELNVVSFNIWCADHLGNNSIASRAPRLKEVLKKIDADIIGLQECTPKWLKHLEEDYSKDYDIYNVYRATHNLESTPILWKKDKFTCLDKGNFWLSDTPEVESEGWCEWKCNRICTWAKLQEKATGKVFLFMNTHFGFGDSCQTKSAKLMRKYNLKLGDYPTVITGDFNMHPDYPAYKEMAVHYWDVNMETTKDMCNTFHSFRPEEHAKELIDYCFVDNGFRPVSYRRITDKVGGHCPSDHYGIQATIRFSE